MPELPEVETVMRGLQARLEGRVIARAATHVLALLGDGRWSAGASAQMIAAPMLRAVYGCDWRETGGVWVAV